MIRSLILLITSCFLINSCIIPLYPPNNENIDNQYALIEDFVENKIGWIEERNEIHELEIRNGYYFIHSKDTSFSHTSTSPLDKSFLFGLIDFELESSFTLVQKSPIQTSYGVFFFSGALRYDFIVDFDGIGIVTEYNSATRNEKTLIDKEISNFTYSPSLNLKIIINEYRFKFYIGDELIGDGELGSRSWQEMRLFVSSGTDLMINSLNIKRL